MLNFVWLYTYTQISVQYQFNHRHFFSNIYYNRKLSKIVKCWTDCCHNSSVISYIYTGLWYIYTLKCSCSFSTNSFSGKNTQDNCQIFTESATSTFGTKLYKMEKISRQKNKFAILSYGSVKNTKQQGNILGIEKENIHLFRINF